jgi:vacuolar iron transporter family protein
LFGARVTLESPQMVKHEDYLRSALFGVQDGLVSTTGVVVGISSGVEDRSVIALVAFVAVTVEASSMAAGQYSSEKAVHQADTEGRHTDSVVTGAAIMFVSYILAGLVPIVPMVLLRPPLATPVTVLAALSMLLVVGYVKGRVVHTGPLRSAVELAVIGGAATAIGLTVGYLFRV